VGANATADDVALLFGRAAFGATKNDLTVWTGKPYADVVKALVVPWEAAVAPQPDDARWAQLSQNDTNLISAQRWFLARMATSPTPLVERMTLFWHTHFATAYALPPDVGNLMIQNQTIRTYALGDLRTLLQQMTVDPAMLYWLSGNQNKKGRVNENYARELFELFTMGTRPQTYTETDIRQAAKALTGWGVNATARAAVFDSKSHDTSTKTVFGRTVGGYPAGDVHERLEYQEVVEAALAQPTTAKFIAYKLVCAFAYVPTTTNLLTNPDPLVDAVAATLKPDKPDGAWDIGAAMTTLLNHSRFRYPDRAAGKALVRSPIEVTAHLGKVMTVNLDPPGGIQTPSGSQYNQPIYALRRMGQVPFQPPNVGGWPKGEQWLSAITTQARYDLAQYMINQYNTQGRATENPMPASTDIAGWTSFMGLGHLSTVTRAQLDAYLASPGTTDERTKQNSVLMLLVSSPDWQVM
jgi:uncharacterized protein (DUF1800 family)